MDVNDCGLFTHTEEMTAVYGDEDILWDSLVREQVSFTVILYGALPENFLLLETIRYTIESLVHRKCVWTGSSDAGHKVSIFYSSFFEVLTEA